jgi:signal transduction histidine kinase
VANAVKFSPPTSTITITARTQNGHVRFCVADEGRGVTSRQREHLFDEFYQAEEDASRRTGGLGLGLYMARRIVERHGGQIWAEPHQFAGLTICFTLPLAGPSA